MSNDSVTVQILDKDYQIRCPAEEHDALRESATVLNKHMRDIRGNGKIVGSERIAVMAALNIAHELVQAQNGGQSSLSRVSKRLKGLTTAIEEALEQGRQLALD